MTTLAAKIPSAAVTEREAMSALSILRRALHALARLVFGKLLPRMPYPVLRGPLRGCWYVLGATAGDAGGVSVHLGLQEIEQSRCLQRLLRPGQAFFDVGANVGFYSLLASRLVQHGGQVIAFEPMPRNLAFLYRHLQLNRASNVTILPVACADRASTELFCEGENNALGRLADSESVQHVAATNRRNTLVSTTTLDIAVQKLCVAPNVIKIDVEGAELRVLEGATDVLTRIRPAVLLSIHSDELRDACLTYLREINYVAEPLNAASIEHATEFVAKPRETLGL
jgi:FkbM family methyltransferase